MILLALVGLLWVGEVGAGHDSLSVSCVGPLSYPGPDGSVTMHCVDAHGKTVEQRKHEKPVDCLAKMREAMKAISPFIEWQDADWHVGNIMGFHTRDCTGSCAKKKELEHELTREKREADRAKAKKQWDKTLTQCVP